MTGGGGNAGDGFSDVPEGRKEKSVLSFHSYGPNGADKHTIRETIDISLKQVKKLGGGLVVSFE